MAIRERGEPLLGVPQVCGRTMMMKRGIRPIKDQNNGIATQAITVSIRLFFCSSELASSSVLPFRFCYHIAAFWHVTLRSGCSQRKRSHAHS
jgi:hypothetical protein